MAESAEQLFARMSTQKLRAIIMQRHDDKGKLICLTLNRKLFDCYDLCKLQNNQWLVANSPVFTNPGWYYEFLKVSKSDVAINQDFLLPGKYLCAVNQLEVASLVMLLHGQSVSDFVSQ